MEMKTTPQVIKRHHLLWTLVLFVHLSIVPCRLWGQLPEYVPQNNILGFWLFNGDSRDYSGNGNHLSSYGPVSVQDGVGYGSSSFLFDGDDDWMTVGRSLIIGQQPLTISTWIKSTYQGIFGMLVAGQRCDTTVCPNDVSVGLNGNYLQKKGLSFFSGPHSATAPFPGTNDGTWHHYVVVMGMYGDYSFEKIRFFIDGKRILIDSNAGQHNWGGWKYSFLDHEFTVGERPTSAAYVETTINGMIDDLGVWGRAFTDEEVQELYERTLAAQCRSVIDVQPSSAVADRGENVTFRVETDTAEGKNTYQWQTSMPGLDWIDLKESQSYGGVTTSTLIVSNVQPRHQGQMFRVFVTSRFCTDTSQAVSLILDDTCRSTVYDTVRVSVSDTLYIELSPASVDFVDSVYLKVYPNPSSSHVVIETEQHQELAGWIIVIADVVGRTLYRGGLTDAITTISLKALSGPGQYFLHLQDNKDSIRVTKVIVIR